MADPQIKYDQAGNAWDVSGGTYRLVRMAPPPSITTKVAPPAYQYEGPQAAATLQRTMQEVAQAQQTAAATTAKTKAEAQKAQLDAATAQEQWNINHPQANGTEGLSGPQYMQWLQKNDPGRAAYIQGLAEGRVPFPGAQMMRSPAGQALLTQVMRADPTIDATNYTTRAAARRNAATGNLSQSDNALITAIGHAARLNSLVPDVFGTPITPFNSIANGIDSSLFSGKQPTYDQNAQLLGDEVAKAYGTNSQGKQNEAGSQFSSSLSTQQKEDNIRGAIDLMASKLAANRAQFAYGNGGLAKPDFMLLPEQTRNQLLSLPGGPEIANKYFAGIPAMGANGGNSGGGNGGSGAAPPPVGPNSSPPGGTPNYSGMVGGPSASLATGAYRNQYDPVMASTLSTFIKKGTPYETAAQFAQSHGFTAPDPKAYADAVAFAKANGGATNVQANREVPTTVGERLASSPLAAAVAGGATGASAGLSDVAGRALVGPEWDANRAALAATNPTADLVGNVAGGTGAMLAGGSVASSLLKAGVKDGAARNLIAWALKNPVKAAIPGDAAYGATYSASEDPDDPLAGATVGAITGAGGGLAGTALAKGAGAALQGVTDPAVLRLQQAGIPLTVGETLGGGWKKAQDALTSVFGPGNMVARRYNEGREALNQAAFNQGGQVIGAPINAVGQAGIDALNTAKNNAYSKALGGVSLNLDVPSFTDPMRGIIANADKIPGGDLPEGYAGVNLRHYIDNNAPDGTMTGAGFQNAYRGLSRTASAAAPKVEGYDVGQAMGQAKDLLASTLNDQNPGAFQDFANANTANRNLNVLANAVNAAKNQIGDNGEPLFTPAQLGSAATNNAKTYNGSIAAAAGNRPFNQLINDAQQVMSSKLPDSGTVGRALITGAALGGGGSAGYGTNGGEGAVEGAAVPLGVLSLLGTRAGQQLLTSALIKRTVADQAAGRAASRYPQVGGAILTSAGIPLLSSQ